MLLFICKPKEVLMKKEFNVINEHGEIIFSSNFERLADNKCFLLRQKGIRCSVESHEVDTEPYMGGICGYYPF